MEFLSKYQWYIYIGIIVIGIIILIIHQFFLKLFEKIDLKKEYLPNKLRKEIVSCRENGDSYCRLYYYVWQKNKLKTLYEMFPVGELLTNNYITTEVATYNTLTDKIFSVGKRQAFYKREFRIYYKFAEIKKSVINNFNHNGIGNQNNKVYQNENNTSIVINQLENFMNEIDVKSDDRTYIESFISRFSQGATTEKDKNKIIETLSKYISVGSNVVSIIANIANLF